MQRNDVFAGILAAMVGAAAPAIAQDAATAAAEREDQELNYKKLTIKLEGFEEALQAQKRNIDKLGEAVHSLRVEIDQLKSRNESAATQDSMRVLKEKIEEVDKKRRDDGELVLRKIAALGKDLTRTIPTPAPARDPVAPSRIEKQSDKNPLGPERPAPGSGLEKGEKGDKGGYEYKIKDGDTLNRIVTELRAQGYKVTQKLVMDANPNVNWNRLSIGQTIRIPPPLAPRLPPPSP